MIPGIGTIANAAAIIAGGVIGLVGGGAQTELVAYAGK